MGRSASATTSATTGSHALAPNGKQPAARPRWIALEPGWQPVERQPLPIRPRETVLRACAYAPVETAIRAQYRLRRAIPACASPPVPEPDRDSLQNQDRELCQRQDEWEAPQRRPET